MLGDRRLRRRRSLAAASRARESALVIVSWVVKVLDATMNSVRSGSSLAQRLGQVRAVDVGDEVRAQALAWRRAASARCRPSPGPRSEPPMPMLTMSVIALAGVAAPGAAADRVDEARACASSTALTSGMTSLPSTRIGRLERLRRATCRTARSSVWLIFCAREHHRPPVLDVGLRGRGRAAAAWSRRRRGAWCSRAAGPRTAARTWRSAAGRRRTGRAGWCRAIVPRMRLQRLPGGGGGQCRHGASPRSGPDRAASAIDGGVIRAGADRTSIAQHCW